LHQLGDVGFRIAGAAIDLEPGIIPPVGENDLIEAPGLFRDRGVDEPGAVSSGSEGRVGRLAPNLVATPGLDPVVVSRIERKEDPKSSVGIEVEHQQEAVDVGIYLEPDSVAGTVATIVVHPEAYRELALEASGFREFPAR